MSISPRWVWVLCAAAAACGTAQQGPADAGIETSALSCPGVPASCVSACEPGKQVAAVCTASGWGCPGGAFPVTQCPCDPTDASAIPTCCTGSSVDDTVSPVCDSASHAYVCPPGSWAGVWPDPSGFAPRDPKPARAPQDACTAQQLQGFFAACLDTSSTAQECAAWLSDADGGTNAPCAQCLDSKKTDPAWGPLVFDQGIAEANIAGCMELLSGENPAPPGSCAYRYQAAQDCVSYACESCFDHDNYDRLQCEQAAMAGGCKNYEDGQCDPDAQTYAACFAGPDFESMFLSVAPLFCSTP